MQDILTAMETGLTERQKTFIAAVRLIQGRRRAARRVPSLATSPEVMRETGMPLHEVERIGAELGAAGAVEVRPSFSVMLYGMPEKGGRGVEV